MDVSQFESLKVTGPPVPASLPLNAFIASKKCGVLHVTVKDSQLDSAIDELDAAGLPNSGRPAAIFSQSAQLWQSALVRRDGGLSCVPRLVASVIEPFWKNTRSSSLTATVLIWPS